MPYREIKLPCYGIVVILGENGVGSISTTLRDPTNDEAGRLFNAAVDGLEALILAQACAGIDIESPQYRDAISTAVDAIQHSYD